MYLSTLYVRGVRNLTEQEIEFGPGFNYLYGQNGAGKTAILEAIHLIARGRSFRSHRASSLIQHNQDELIVRLQLEAEGSPHRVLALSKNRKGSTGMRESGLPVKRASELARHLPVQTLLPDAADLLFGPPSGRRGFLDWGLFHVEPAFVDIAGEYRRVLAQRNAWLKSLDVHEYPVEVEEDPWFQLYREKAIQLSIARARYVDELIPHFNETLSLLAPELSVDLRYDWGGLADAEQADKKMSESLSRDVKFGTTHRGPHRGNLLIEHGAVPLADDASRGQAKLTASAIILAQAKLLLEKTQESTLFLIDDFGAELDREHWVWFVEALVGMGCQIIATSTEQPRFSHFNQENLQRLDLFHVKQGRINSLGPTT